MNNLFRQKKFRFGGYSVLLTAVVVALVILFNAVITALAGHFGWYFDMTPEKLYELSGQTKEYLSQIDGESNHVTIYFFTGEDRLNLGVTSADSLGESGYWGMQPIHEMAKQLDESFDFISVDYIDANAEPERIREIVGDSYDSSTYTATTVIVDNYAEYKDAAGNVYDRRHEYRVYPRETFFTYNYQNYAVSAFIGDYRFCTAIRSVTMEDSRRPVAYFLSGHSEDIGPYDYTDEEQSADYGGAAALWQLFRDSGYTARKIDLRYEDFEPDPDGVAVIYGPVTDYISSVTSGQFDEIGKLENFLSEGGHSLMVYMNPKVMNLPNLEGFLKDHAGVTFDPVKLRDDGRSSVDAYGILGTPVPSTGKAGDVISGLDGFFPDGQRMIFSEACSMTVVPDGGAQTLYGVPESSYGIPVGASDGFALSDGAALMTLTETPAGGQIICCGSTYSAYGEYIDRDAYANRELTLRLLDGMNGSGRVSSGIPVKVIRDEGLDRTTGDVMIWTLALSVGLPLIFAVAGTVIYIRRRHS